MATGINTGGVVKGGLVAGLILNIGEFVLNVPVAGAQMDAAISRLGLPPMPNSAIAIFVAMCFGLGLFLVWLYAAIRPRLGPGPGTAVCAALIVWGLAYLWPSVANVVLGIFPVGLTALTVVWGLGEVVLAALAGAWLYRE